MVNLSWFNVLLNRVKFRFIVELGKIATELVIDKAAN